jgi:hypothetical protein
MDLRLEQKPMHKWGYLIVTGILEIFWGIQAILV